jgi:transcriptional regulator with XRE-family HTH domain
VVLDTAIPPRRLGRALRTARRGCGLRRRAVAAELGVSLQRLTAWERGHERISEIVAARFVALYGDALTTLVPERQPVRLELGRIEVGGKIRILASQARDDVLGGYVELLTALRQSKPGKVVPLRTADLRALADALGRDVDDVEARIVELLHCTGEEAAALHAELRRRMLVPAAGLAVGVAAWAGGIAAAAHDAPALHAPERSIAHAQTVATEHPVTTTPPTTVAPTTTSTTDPPTTTTAPAPVAPVAPVAPSTTPSTTAAPAPTTSTTTPAAPTPDVGIPAGETPTILAP